MKKKNKNRISEGLRKTLIVASLLCIGVALRAQNTVTGKASDENGALSGVTVTVRGTNVGVLTGTDGSYSIGVPDNNATLVFSLMGFTAQEVAVGGRTVVDVVLKEEVEEIDEVVVVGYGTQKKVNLSGSVSAITAKSLANRPVTNANYALQGLAPNLNITQTTGNPTAAPGINIRGYTSINGGEAFILVDNVPVTAGELSRINPADIESVSVLRDAAAAAIYGARAAFGVVLITTKTAKSSRIEIDADLNVGIRKFIELPEPLQDTYWAMYFQRITANDMNRFNDASLEYAKRRMADPSLPEVIDPSVGWNPTYTNSGQWDYYANTNWYDVALHDAAATHNYTLRVAQKTDRLSYAVSGGYYQQNSLVKYEEPYKRYNFRGNANYRIIDRWQLGSNVSYTRSDYSTPRMARENDNDQNIFYHMQSKYIFRPVYNPDGSWTQDGGGTAVGLMRDGGKFTQGRNETQLSFNTQVDILKDVWFVKGDVNFRMEDYRGSLTEFPVYHRQGPGMQQAVTWGGSSATTQRDANYLRYTVVNVYTDFHKTFADKHYVQALAGFNQEDWRNGGFWTKSEGLISESYPTPGLSTGAKTNGEWANALALRGWFGRLNYVYDNRYIVEFNGRRDATSRFPRNSRWGFFPSASAAWNVSNEHFLESVAETLKVNMFKLRASYGTLGNQTMGGYYPFYPTMSDGTTYSVLDGKQQTMINAPGTPAAGDLTWETVRTVNFGLDLALFNSRFDLAFDKYTRYTEGMLTRGRELPAPFGASPPQMNAADLKTDGWELSVGWRDKFELAGSPFNYSVRVMIADARAEITKYDNPAGNIGDWYVGKEPGEIWGFVTAGFFNTEEDIANWHDQTSVSAGFNGSKPYLGDIKFMNLDGDKHKNADGKATINEGSGTLSDPGDRKIIGNSSIRYPYSFDLSFDWKGFDVRAFFQGVGQREFYPTGIVFFGQYADNPWCSPNTKNLDNWGTPENYNPDAYYPKITHDVRLWRTQTKYLQNAAYLRLKNLTLGYTLPRELTERWKISRLRVFFSGENILTFDHIDVPGTDPEVFDTNTGAMRYLPQKVYSFGLNLSF
jgi:TonB-linked SusC/RagA family outer membrane protein